MNNSVCRIVFALLMLLGCKVFAQEQQSSSTETDGKYALSRGPKASLTSPSFGKRNDELWERMQATPPDQDREFLMVNLMKFREKASYADGRTTNLTGEEANAQYSPIQSLAKIGANVEYISRVNDQIGNSEPRWDEVGIVRYPSRAKFIEMVTNPDFEKKAIHKDAGLDVSQVLVTERVPWILPKAGRFRAAIDSLMLAQLLKFRDIAEYSEATERVQKRTGKEAMDAFDGATEDLLRKAGARPILKSKVVGTLIGDGRTWDEFRLLQFPSQAALAQYLVDVKNLKDASNHRDAAIEDIYELKAETMSLAKRLALSFATAAVGRKDKPASRNSEVKQQDPE